MAALLCLWLTPCIGNRRKLRHCLERRPQRHRPGSDPPPPPSRPGGVSGCPRTRHQCLRFQRHHGPRWAHLRLPTQRTHNRPELWCRPLVQSNRDPQTVSLAQEPLSGHLFASGQLLPGVPADLSFPTPTSGAVFSQRLGQCRGRWSVLTACVELQYGRVVSIIQSTAEQMNVPGANVTVGSSAAVPAQRINTPPLVTDRFRLALGFTLRLGSLAGNGFVVYCGASYAGALRAFADRYRS